MAILGQTLMLSRWNLIFTNDTAQASDHDTAQAGVQVNDQVQRLILAMKQEDYILAELMQFVGFNLQSNIPKELLESCNRSRVD